MARDDDQATGNMYKKLVKFSCVIPNSAFTLATCCRTSSATSCRTCVRV